MLADVKLAIGLSDTLYDAEISGFIASAKIDLGFGNVDTVTETDSLTKSAIITYCTYMFQLIHGDTDRAEKLKAAYDSLKMQMGTSSNYREWGDVDG